MRPPWALTKGNQMTDNDIDRDVDFTTTLIAAYPGFSVIRGWHDEDGCHFDTEPVIAWRIFVDPLPEGHQEPVTPSWNRATLYEPRYALVFPDGHISNEHVEVANVDEFKKWYEQDLLKRQEKAGKPLPC
jgi:hypothetical protein